MNCVKHWHAIYTKSRAEKKVHDTMKAAGYEVYLPLHKVTRKWSDREKEIEVPLISSYVFVRVSEAEYYKVLNTDGVVAYVTFEGKAAKIPDNQIEALKLSLTSKMAVEPVTRRFKRGQEVEVISGPLIGMHGKVYTEAGKTAFIIDMYTIGYSLKVTVSATDIQEKQLLAE